jgi:hypothetical protein
MKRLLLLTMLLSVCFLNVSILRAAERPQRVQPQTVQPNAPAPPVARDVPSILSIIPAQGEPGGKVSIFGSGFGEQAVAFLGSVEVPARVTDGKQLEFVIPKLDAGLYALYVKRGDGAAGRVYNFTVLALRPILTSLNPDSISMCDQGTNRDVTANGKNFSETSVILFDGAVISSRFLSPEQLSFNVPNIAGGLHQVMVKNGPENGSVPFTLTLDTRPEISQVSIGNENVNYYEISIYGKNFHQNSAIYVDGQRIGGKGGQEIGEREKLIFLDCTRLLYQRHPYSSTNKDFRIQVFNQAGEESQVVNVTAP